MCSGRTQITADIVHKLLKWVRLTHYDQHSDDIWATMTHSDFSWQYPVSCMTFCVAAKCRNCSNAAIPVPEDRNKKWRCTAELLSLVYRLFVHQSGGIRNQWYLPLLNLGRSSPHLDICRSTCRSPAPILRKRTYLRANSPSSNPFAPFLHS